MIHRNVYLLHVFTVEILQEIDNYDKKEYYVI